MKVVIGDRRIGNRQCLDPNYLGRAAVLAAALVEILAAALAAAVVAALTGRHEL